MAGVLLAAAFGYVLDGTVGAAIVCVAVAAVLVGHGMSQRDAASTWLVGLGVFSSLSRLDVGATQAALGDLRVPIMVVGVAVALLVGIVTERGRPPDPARSS